jgi:hypothetical protein
MAPGRYSVASRPHASYYCYDCHGYRFFDPYYDWCTYYGFRYRWEAHPRVTQIYRERYVRIRESHPEYGRYQYRGDYRASLRYREARDYERWRRSREDRSDARRPGEIRKGKNSKDRPPKSKETRRPERKERRDDRRSFRLEGGSS